MKTYSFDSLGNPIAPLPLSLGKLGRCPLTPLFFLLLLLAPGFSNAAALKQAEVSQVIRDVKLLARQAPPRPAAIRDTVRDGTAVRTGVKSRAELTFTDRTLARLGANTVFSFNEGTRNLELGGGAMLLQVPKNSGGAQINTASVTASITGTTIILEYHPNAYVKFIILEGTGRIFLNHHLGESVLVHAGQMMIVNPNATKLPDPVDVDLNRLMKTSLLITGFGSLPSDFLIGREIQTQLVEKTDGGLLETNLVIPGGGTVVAVLPTPPPTLPGSGSGSESSGVHLPTPPPATPTPFPSTTPTPTPRSTVTPTPSPTVSATPTPSPSISPTPSVSPTATPVPSKVGPPSPIASPVPYLIGSSTTIETDPTILTKGVTNFGTIYRGQAEDGLASKWLFTSTSAFDTASGFHEYFSNTDHLPFGALKFLALRLVGNPTISISDGGPTKLALVSVGDITSGAPGGSLTFSGLDTLLLATQDGSVSLTSDLAFQNIPNLYIYARGSGANLIFDSAISGMHNLFLVAQGNIVATSNLTLNGVSAGDASSILLFAGENIEVGGALSAGIFEGETMIDPESTTINAGGDLIVGGAITIGGNVTVGGNVSSGDLIQVDGALIAGGSISGPALRAATLQAGSDIMIDGTNRDFGFGIAADTISAGGTLHFINAPSITFLNTYSDGSEGPIPVDFSLTTTAIASSGAIIPTLLFNGADASPDFANDNPGSGGRVTLNLTGGGLTIGSGGDLAGIEANGGSFALDSSGGGKGGIVDITASGDIHLTNGDIFATSGLVPAAGRATIGSGGAATLTSAGTITVDSTIEVSSNEKADNPGQPTRRSSSGGNISLTSMKQSAGTAILINNTGQLRSLLDQAAPGRGGKITILATGSGGSNVTVNGNVEADRGTVLIRHNGENGTVNLGDATGADSVSLHGDIVKAGALGPNGTLTIGRGVISADDTVKLYAATASGQVHFVDNVTIGGHNFTVIAADTVTIDNGRIVTVNGQRADVYTGFRGQVPNANYSGFGGNGSTTGTFGGAGANNPQPLSKAPPFDGPPGG